MFEQVELVYVLGSDCILIPKNNPIIHDIRRGWYLIPPFPPMTGESHLFKAELVALLRKYRYLNENQEIAKL